MAGSGIERARVWLPQEPKVVSARTIREAFEKTENGAGENELEKILAWLKRNPATLAVREWKRTLNYFPGAKTDREGRVLCLYNDYKGTGGGTCQEGYCDPGSPWSHGIDRVIVESSD